MSADRIMRQFGAGQNITVGAASVATTAAPAGITSFRISTTGNCHISIGATPTAAATDQLVKASDPTRDVAITQGEKVAVIQDGASTGTCNIVWLSQ